MKKLLKIIIGLIMLAIVAVVVYVIFFEKAEAPENINTQTISANWKTYSVKSYTISLQAPADLHLVTNSGLADETAPSFNPSFTLNIPKQDPYFHTHLINDAYIQVNPASTTCSQSGDEVVNRKDVVIGSDTFNRIEWSGVGAGNIYQGVDYTTTKNGECYEVTLFTHSTNGEGFYTNDPVQIKTVDALQAMDIKDLFASFDQVAGTIKFTK